MPLSAVDITAYHRLIAGDALFSFRCITGRKKAPH